MKEEIPQALIAIYSGVAWEAALVKNKLEDGGIKAYIRDGNLSPNDDMNVMPGTWDTVSVMVAKENVEKARPIVADYEKEHPRDD